MKGRSPQPAAPKPPDNHRTAPTAFHTFRHASFTVNTAITGFNLYCPTMPTGCTMPQQSNQEFEVYSVPRLSFNRCIVAKPRSVMLCVCRCVCVYIFKSGLG